MLPTSVPRRGSGRDDEPLANGGFVDTAPLSSHGLSGYLDALAETIAAATAVGARRDAALAAFLGAELLDGIIVRRWFEELAETERAMIRHAASDFVRHWADPAVCAHLEPVHRIMVHCLRHGNEDDLIDVVRYRAFGTAVRTVVDAGRVYAGLPLFRNPATDIPDWCYEISESVTVEHRLTELSWNGGRLRLAGYAFINQVDTDDQATSIVLRERTSGAEHAVLARIWPTPQMSGRFHDGLYDYGHCGFDAVVDLDALPGDRALPDGVWELLVEVRAHGVSRRCPVRRLPEGDRGPRVDHQLPDFTRRDPGLVTTYVGDDGVVTLFLAAYSDASADLVRMTCCESSGVGLTISVYSGLSGWPPGTTARLCLVRGDVTRTFAAVMRPSGAGFSLTAHLRASKLLLPPGWWGVGLRLAWEHGRWEVPVHDARGRQVWLRGRRSARELLGRARDAVRA